MASKRTKADRKRQRRGDGAVSLPSGKASKAKTAAGYARAMRAEAADAVALRARCRVYGLTETQAADPLAGTATGRLVLAGLLTRRHDDAATRWQNLRRRYHAAIDARAEFREGRGAGASTEDRDEADEKAVKAFMGAYAALMSAGPIAEAAVRLAVELGRDIPQSIDDLRCGLRALADHFGLPEA